MMLHSIRKNTKALLVNLMLFMLVASFALWGIGDIFRGGFGDNYVAKVGNATIGPNEYQSELRFRLSNLRQILGENYSEELVNQLRLPQQVLQNMVQSKLISQEASALGITLSEEEIMAQIRQNEAFQRGSQFDKDTFQSALRQAGLTEERYTESIAHENATRLLMESFNGHNVVSDTLVNLVDRTRSETRDISLYTVEPVKAAQVETPSEEALKTFFEDSKEQFRTPEYRSLRYIEFPEKKIFGNISVSPEALRELYEERKAAHMIPEKRDISQLLYDSRDQAMQAHGLLKQGKTLSEVAKTVTPSNKELELGSIRQAELPKDAQSIVFSLDESNFTNPIETGFGWHIFNVKKISPAEIPSFESLKEQLLSELMEREREDKLYDFSIEIEDQIAGGQSLDNIAQEHGLDLVSTQPVDQLGNYQDVVSKSDLPSVDNLFSLLFSDTLQDEPQLVKGSDGSYYLLSLGEVVEPTIPEFEVIHADILSAYKEEQATKQTKLNAESLAESMKSGNSSHNVSYKTETFSTLAHPDTLTGPESKEAQRIDSTLRDAAFSLNKGDTSNAYPQRDGSYAIVKVTATNNTVGSKDTPAYKSSLATIRNELENTYTEELSNAYLQHLQKKYPLQVNGKLLESLLN